MAVVKYRCCCRVNVSNRAVRVVGFETKSDTGSDVDVSDTEEVSYACGRVPCGRRIRHGSFENS